MSKSAVTKTWHLGRTRQCSRWTHFHCRSRTVASLPCWKSKISSFGRFVLSRSHHTSWSLRLQLMVSWSLHRLPAAGLDTNWLWKQKNVIISICSHIIIFVPVHDVLWNKTETINLTNLQILKLVCKKNMEWWTNLN